MNEFLHFKNGGTYFVLHLFNALKQGPWRDAYDTKKPRQGLSVVKIGDNLSQE